MSVLVVARTTMSTQMHAFTPTLQAILLAAALSTRLEDEVAAAAAQGRSYTCVMQSLQYGM